MLGRASLIALLALATTGCGGDAFSAKVRETPVCVEVSEALIATLADALTVTGGGILRGVRAVRSPDHEKVWYVAGEIQAPGMESQDEIAVWATNIEPTHADPNGNIFSVNTMAAESSQWPRNQDIGENTSAARAVGECSRKAVTS